MSQVQLGGSGVALSGGIRTANTQIAVTPFNPNDQTPRVAGLRVTSPTLERHSTPLLCPRVSAEELKTTLSSLFFSEPSAVG
jgi:hypothetical protein